MEYSQKKATGKNRIYVFAFSCSVVSCFILPPPPPLASAAIKVSASASAQIHDVQQLQLKSNICSSCTSTELLLFWFEGNATSASDAYLENPLENFLVFCLCICLCLKYNISSCCNIAPNTQWKSPPVLLSLLLSLLVFVFVVAYACAQIKHLPNTQPNIWTFEQLQALLYYKLCLFKNTYKFMFLLRWSVSVCNFVCY